MLISLLAFIIIVDQALAATVHSSDIATLSPCEIVWDSTVRAALQILRKSKHLEVETLTSSVLYPCMHDNGTNSRHLTLTLVGDKGGSPIEQTNQDRGFIHFSRSNPRPGRDIVIAGVSDGHGILGHHVAEWIRHQLTQSLIGILSDDTKPISAEEIAELVTNLNESMPPVLGSSGGATLSFLVREGDSLYFSNTGDSKSFLAAAILEDEGELNSVEVVFSTKLHKPNSTLERSRLESLGYAIDDEENRVWYSVDGEKQGMATSRTIGDHEAGRALIPNPDVTELSVTKVLNQLMSQVDCEEVRADGSLVSTTCNKEDATSLERIHLFAVSATDGVLDYVEPEAIAYQVSHVARAFKELYSAVLSLRSAKHFTKAAKCLPPLLKISFTRHRHSGTKTCMASIATTSLLQSRIFIECSDSINK